MMLRPIAFQDLEPLVLLCKEHADYEGLHFSENGQLERWRAGFFGPMPKLYGWVCEMYNALVGYMTATIDYSTWAARPFVYLDCLYLQPQVRRKGIGRALMEELITFAQSQNCLDIQWQTPPNNEIGLRFYRALGAKELSKARFTLSIKMEKEGEGNDSGLGI